MLALVLGAAHATGVTENDILRRLPWESTPQGYSPFSCEKYAGYYCSYGDGDRTATPGALFYGPTGLAFHDMGDGEAIYIADKYNGCIRKILGDDVTTYAGLCSDEKVPDTDSMTLEVPYADARLYRPKDIMASPSGTGIVFTAGDSVVLLRGGTASLVHKESETLNYLAVNRHDSGDNYLYVTTEHRVLRCDVEAKTCETFLGQEEYNWPRDGNFTYAAFAPLGGLDWYNATTLVIAEGNRNVAEMRIAYTDADYVTSWKADGAPTFPGSVRWSDEFGLIVTSKYGRKDDDVLGDATEIRFYNDLFAPRRTKNEGITAVDAVYLNAGGPMVSYGGVSRSSIFMTTDDSGSMHCQVWQCSLASFSPTSDPTVSPTTMPTEVPSPAPTPSPSEVPSPMPTPSPTGYDCQVLAGVTDDSGTADGAAADARFSTYISSMGLIGSVYPGLMVVDRFNNCIRQVALKDVPDHVNGGPYSRGHVHTFAGTCTGDHAVGTDGLFASSEHYDGYDGNAGHYRPSNITLDEPFRMTWRGMNGDQGSQYQDGVTPLLLTEAGVRNPPGKIKIITRSDISDGGGPVYNLTTVTTCADLDADFGGVGNEECYGITLGFKIPPTGASYSMGTKMFVSTGGSNIHMCDVPITNWGQESPIDLTTCLCYFGHEDCLITYDDTSDTETHWDMMDIKYSRKWGINGALIVSKAYQGEIWILDDANTDSLATRVYHGGVNGNIGGFDVAGDHGLIVGSLSDPEAVLHSPGQAEMNTGQLTAVVSPEFTTTRSVFVPAGNSQYFDTYIMDQSAIKVCNAYTHYPTNSPTRLPTADPTEFPPTGQPTADPTAEPTAMPSADPTKDPTGTPTAQPTLWPNYVTAPPTPEPTVHPLGPAPTDEPTAEPTSNPSTQPTADPTAEPTSDPTAEPTADPTAEPSANPTMQPIPTFDPTPAPTEKPEESSGIGTGALVGIVLGAVLVVALVIIGVAHLGGGGGKDEGGTEMTGTSGTTQGNAGMI